MSQRFYRRSDFEDAFGRYLADGSEPSVTSVTSVTSVMKAANVIRNPSENKADDAYDGYDGYDGCPKHDGSKVQHDGWEGEI